MDIEVQEEYEKVVIDLQKMFGDADEEFIKRVARDTIKKKYGNDGLRIVMRPAQNELMEVKRDVNDEMRDVYTTTNPEEANNYAAYANNQDDANSKCNDLLMDGTNVIQSKNTKGIVLPKINKKAIRDNLFNQCYIELIKVIIVIDEDLYYYNNELNYYKKINNNDETKEIAKFLINRNASMAGYYNPRFVNDLIKMIKEVTPYNSIKWDDVNIPKDEINYKNKIIGTKINRGIFTYCINAMQVEKKYFKHKFFDEYCRESFYDVAKMQGFLFEVIGYLISEFSGDKAFLLLGDDSRTNVIIELLDFLLGKEEIAYKSISGFKEFRKSKDLSRKKINITKLTSFANKDIDLFCAMLKSRYVQIENNKRAISDIVHRVKFVFYCKCIPEKLKANDLLMDNFIIVNFNKSGRSRKGIFEDIKNNGEVDTLFTLAKEKLEILKENNFEFSVNEDYKKIFNNSSHILEFINEFCDTGTEYKIYKSDLVEAYEKFCKENYIAERYSDHKFIEFIASLDNIEEKKIRAVKGGRPKASFTGIKLKEFQE